MECNGSSEVGDALRLSRTIDRGAPIYVGLSSVGVAVVESAVGDVVVGRERSSWRARSRDKPDGCDGLGGALGVISPEAGCVESVEVEASRSVTSSAGLNDSSEVSDAGVSTFSSSSLGDAPTSGNMNASCECAES